MSPERPESLATDGRLCENSQYRHCGLDPQSPDMLISDPEPRLRRSQDDDYGVFTQADGLAPAREAAVQRETRETSISLSLSLDGRGDTSVSTGIAFFDHMLDAIGRHGGFDLAIDAKGDLDVDAHHTVEDVGIVFGQAIALALGDKSGITRFADAIVCMDEALVLAAIDISGRGQLHWEVELPMEFIGNFDTSLFREFLIALAAHAGLTLHLRSLAGWNSHHVIEAAAKAFARALRTAVRIDAALMGRVPSTKGVL
jgi:imidazoleglycerol-phosphate dehydratase